MCTGKSVIQSNNYVKLVLSYPANYITNSFFNFTTYILSIGNEEGYWLVDCESLEHFKNHKHQIFLQGSII